MNELFRTLNSDSFISRTTKFTLAAIFLGLLYIVLNFGKLPPFAPLFNQMPWGEQRIAPTIFIFLPTIISVVVFLLNIFLLIYIYKRNPLVSRLFSAMSILISILVLIFIIKTIHSLI